MCKKLMVLVLFLCVISSAGAETVVWDFENGNDHRFNFQSAYPAAVGIDDPNTAGDETITGVGGISGLPDTGVAWTVGEPNQFDGQKPAVAQGARVGADGLLDYSLGPEIIPVGSGYLNTFNLNQNGEQLHTASNDQIASSPVVILGEDSVLTVWSLGGGANTHAPEYDPNPAFWYTDGSCGIAVISAEEDDLYAILGTIHIQSQGTLTEYTLDLSAFAGRKIFIDVVDSAEGDMGWIAVEKIQIANANIKYAAILVDWGDDVNIGFDRIQIDRLEDLGYTVVVVQQEDIGSTFTIDDANALDLLIFSESVLSDHADPLIGTTTPIMTQEANGWDNWFHMGASVDADWKSGSEAEVVNDTHPIAVAAGLSVGPMTFYSETGNFTTDVVSNLAPGAESIVQVIPDGQTDAYAKVFVIDKGAELANGTPSPNRVVGFTVTGYHQVTVETMTPEAWALWDASIAWLDTDAISIPVENFSFELPGGAKQTSWETVPGWSSDTVATDSGCEEEGNWKQTDGNVNGYIRAGDSSAYNLLIYIIEAGDVLTLSIDAFNEWMATQFKISLYYDDAGVRVPLVSDVFDVTDDYQTFSVTVDIADVPEAVGHQLGIEVENVTPVDDSWVGMDNVRVTKEL